MDFNNIARGIQRKPIKAVIYGVPGVGKTTFASGAEKAIFADVEGGSSNLDVTRFPEIASWTDVMETINYLFTEDHAFDTYVMDSLTALQSMARDHVLQINGWQSIEDPGYGKGYTAVAELFSKFMIGCDALVNKGMNVYLVAHAAITKFQDPTGDDFDQYTLDIEKRLAPSIKAWADCLLFADHDKTTKEVGEGFNKRRIGKSWGERVLYTQHRASHEAKNRYNLPERMPLDHTLFIDSIESFYNPIKETTNAA